MSARSLAILCFIVGYLSFQVAIPLVLLVKRGGFLSGDPGLAKHFSWQMYGSRPGGPQFIAVYKNGRRKKLDPRRHVGWVRARILYGRYLPRELCKLDPKIVRIDRMSKAGRERFKC